MNPFSFYRDERGRARGVIVSNNALFWLYVAALLVIIRCA